MENAQQTRYKKMRDLLISEVIRVPLTNAIYKSNPGRVSHVSFDTNGRVVIGVLLATGAHQYLDFKEDAACNLVSESVFQAACDRNGRPEVYTQRFDPPVHDGTSKSQRVLFESGRYTAEAEDMELEVVQFLNTVMHRYVSKGYAPQDIHAIFVAAADEARNTQE